MRRRPVALLRLRGLVLKEVLQVVRDPSSILIAFVLPAVLLFLFGYGVSLDARNVELALIVETPSAETQSFIASFANSPYFRVRIARHRKAAEDDLEAGRIKGIVVLAADFASRLGRGDAGPIQVIVDGADANTARLVGGYVQGVWGRWLQIEALDRGLKVPPPLTVEPRVWFNPELRSRNFLVPGLIAIIVTLIGTLLTALVVAREWERGTMEALMATPAGIRELLAGKLVPYFLLGLGGTALSVAMAVWLFGVPLRGSVTLVFAVASVFLVAALALGLFISTIARNQFVAAQIALISSFLPAMMLSGFIFEIGSMPGPIQAITTVVAARYFVSALQTLFLAGNVWSVIVPDVLAMAAIATFFLIATARKSRKRLD